MEVLMIKRKPKLIIVGNGFDLAHGLKTSYNHFLEDYIRDATNAAINSNKRSYKDDSIDLYYPYNELPKNKNLQGLIKFIKEGDPNIKLEINNNFLAEIFNHSNDKWVNIEKLYYEWLKEFINKEIELSGLVRNFEHVYKLNTEFHSIKVKLSKYLKDKVEPNLKHINMLFKSHFLDLEETDLILSFNYTSTLHHYKSSVNPKINFITIHGNVNDNPPDEIIFGYGDEKDSYFDKIENLDDNRLSEHLKSYAYFDSSYRRQLDEFLNKTGFTTEIIGHSCSISDRAVLSNIFEHENCNNIRIHYYQTKAHHKELIREVSRNINQDLRIGRILPYDEQYRCPQWNDKYYSGSIN